jgi:glucosamine--fructose-6-phosphate aminotransferase (isomerizing)
MCGIYGYVGQPTEVVPIVANALRTMEYRGYDSWGIGWDDGSRFAWQKEPGRVPVDMGGAQMSGLAIGHTRWATHGRVTAENAHPHFDTSGQVGIVHNGVIENIAELRASFGGATFLSETDSEIVAHLVGRSLAQGTALSDAVEGVFRMLTGSNAILVAHRPSGQICAITSRSPLRLGRQGHILHLASDPLALADIADEIVIVPDRTLVTLGSTGATLRNIDSNKMIDLVWHEVPEEIRIERGIHAHFTLKEIHDQPDMLRRLGARSDDVVELAMAIRSHEHLLLTGCGSAYYAAALGAELFRQELHDVWVDVVPASEIDARTRNLGPKTLMLALTQSGETADVVDAVHAARSWGASVATLVNTESSTIATQADIAVPLLAGTERSVLATKSFLSMVMRQVQILSHLTADRRSPQAFVDAAIGEIERWLPRETLNKLAGSIHVHDHVLTLGKGVGHKVALEAALKIKEGSYVHAEAFLTGELKHGPLALVSEGTPCLLFATTPDELEGARIASHEIMSRGGYTIGFGAFEASDCSTVVRVPHLGVATTLVHIVIAQVLAYNVAIARGLDPDYPRNLAKSVTVR